MKKGKNIIIFLILTLISLFTAVNVPDTVADKLISEDFSDASELEVHFIDVGQGDSTLILCGGEAMLIDAGDNSQGTNVQNYITKQGVDKLKYVIGTHPDADHIGGLDVILYKFDCETVMLPDKEKDTNTYRDVIDTMNSKKYKNTLPKPGQSYTIGDAVFTILSPVKNYESSNNCSIVLLLEHGNNSFIFSGDAEVEAESDILKRGFDINADVLKIGHHGSSSSSSQDYLDAISPDYAVISCGEGNSYGHPHAETLNNLRAMKIDVYRTDEQGSIIASSDKNKITWNCAPSDTWLTGN